MTDSMALLQGASLIDQNVEKTQRVSLRKVDSDNCKPGGQGCVEGFTGGTVPTPLSQAKNAAQEKILSDLRSMFQAAINNYSAKQDDLMKATQRYLDERNKSTSQGNKLVKLPNGATGYVTTQGTYKFIPDATILSSLQGKNGCPSEIEPISGNPRGYNKPGSMLGTDPSLVVGTPMQQGQSCMNAGSNVQVMGVSDPDTNTASFMRCTSGQESNFELTTGTQTTDPDLAIRNCSTAAADLGRSGFYIDKNSEGSLRCFTAKSGYDLDAASMPVKTEIVKTSTIFALDTISSSARAGILWNSQVAITTASGDLGDDISNAPDLTTWSIPGVDGCSTSDPPMINVTSATYGGNCMGQTKKWSFSPDVETDNVIDTVKSHVSGKTTGAYRVASGMNLLTIPMLGCNGNFTSTYNCNVGEEDNGVTIDSPAIGKVARYDCSAARKKCGGRLSIGDNGNVTLTSGDGSLLWQSATYNTGLAVTARNAANSTFKRNYIESGESIGQGDIIGSPSGNCFIYLDISGPPALCIGYSVLGCSNNNDSALGSKGTVGKEGSSQAVYKMKDGNIDQSNFRFKSGDVAYVDANMSVSTVDRNNIGLGSSYFTLDRYDSPGNDLSHHKDTDLTACKQLCTSLDDCYGLVHTTGNDCFLKDRNVFPKGLRVPNETSQLLVRKMSVNGDPSCPTTVSQAYAETLSKLETKDTDSGVRKCGLALATAKQQKALQVAGEELQRAVTKIKTGVTSLSQEEGKMNQEMLSQINTLLKDAGKYERVREVYQEKSSSLVNVGAMKESSELGMISDNYHFIVWTMLACALIIGGIKASR